MSEVQPWRQLFEKIIGSWGSPAQLSLMKRTHMKMRL